MPKLKKKSGAKKRFKVTGTGTVLYKQSGKRHGMMSLEDSLVRLVQQGAITVEDARIRSARPDEFESLMRRGPA